MNLCCIISLIFPAKRDPRVGCDMRGVHACHLHGVICTWNLVDGRWNCVIYKQNKILMLCTSDVWLIYKPFEAHAVRQGDNSVAVCVSSAASLPAVLRVLTFIFSAGTSSPLAVLKTLFLFPSHGRLLVCLARRWHQQPSEPRGESQTFKRKEKKTSQAFSVSFHTL